MVWCIGIGEAVQIKEDWWLLGRANCFVISPVPSLAPDVNISSLIDQDRVAWKTKVVQQMFLPHEADIILDIPLSIRRPDDRIIWAHMPSGMFTTCSAYKMLVSCDTSSSVGHWQLRVLNKIKNFVWRICNNALPTMVNLYRHHIIPSASCAQCNALPRDSLHAIWSMLEWFHQTAPPHPNSFSELLASFMVSREEFKAEIFVIIVWLLWNRCNAIQFGRPPLPVSSICSKAGSYLQEFLKAQTEELVPPRPPPMQYWRPPDPHCFKVNFDAVVFLCSSLAGISVIVRSNGGEVVGAMSSPIPMAQSVANLEALVCLKAIQFALEIGLT
ncbi:hypothetical protein ACB092_07G052900 [Castanea dentata]